jgi:hypothetical protein
LEVYCLTSAGTVLQASYYGGSWHTVDLGGNLAGL